MTCESFLAAVTIAGAAKVAAVVASAVWTNWRREGWESMAEPPEKRDTKILQEGTDLAEGMTAGFRRRLIVTLSSTSTLHSPPKRPTTHYWVGHRVET
jgi:hypothetical protein